MCPKLSAPINMRGPYFMELTLGDPPYVHVPLESNERARVCMHVYCLQGCSTVPYSARADERV